MNFSDRFLSKVSGTTQMGNSPNTVAEYLRKVGVPKQEHWDFTSDIDTFEKFYAKLPPKLFDYAREDFLEKYQFKHEYVVCSPDKMKLALQQSPLGFSVHAWIEKDGLYFKPQGATDNHWVMCFGYEDMKYWKIFDSYDQSIKHVEWWSLPTICKRYWIKKKEPKEKGLGRRLWEKFIYFWD